jgi:hypothetical protein
MLYSKLPNEQVAQFLPLIQEMVKNEVEKAMALQSKLYEQHIKRLEQVRFSSIKILCKEIGKSRQQVHNWELGKVSGIDISGHVLKNGRFKTYDVDGIKSVLQKNIDMAERSGSTRFSKRPV